MSRGVRVFLYILLDVMMVSRALVERYEGIKRQLLDLDFICVGSLTRVFQECGKPNCRCHQDTKYRHGPYYFWTRKVKGKTVTRKLTPQEAQQCRQWIRNNRKLNSIIHKMQKISCRAAPWCR